ncbi:M56 family metallopeptidase [Flavobacterium cerinum]|uniref:M56 family metallopeptidase n=1 Tax=Flavobacterium cerinum TaxID=2502784 RepID=A0A3S3RLH4_9FLAO|nr:M56 family metallopeptidase [Flavobacterium cerinum]RWX03574.1 M56 family metallopeptidase [Flavobacterium cerinum]
MMEFLLKSSLCLMVLLAIYRLFLEREKMHRFNRFYLLFALAFSLTVPFVTIEIEPNDVINPIAATGMILEKATVPSQLTIVAETSTNYIAITTWSLYSLITILLLVRFIININHFIKKRNKNPLLKYGPATLVLIPEKVLPHTFLSYIFINIEDYEANAIENELYAHELTHVKQKHTIDILFIEILKTVFWFNPLLYFYKKAIQLNHEFLADEKVVSSFDNAVFYQQLLLEKAAIGNPFYLASNLNFSLTKKRLLMMTKSTSKTKSTILKAVLIPVVVIGLLFISALKTINTENNNPETISKANYYKNTNFSYTASNGDVKVKKYNDFTETEKKNLPAPPQSSEGNHPSLKQWNEWKNDANMSIWVDNRKIEKSDLDSFNPADLTSYSGNDFVYREVNNNYAKPQVFLYTKKGFENQYNSLQWPKPIEYKELARYKPANTDC